MSAIVSERKRKRVATKPALKSKKSRRAAAYHSSSSEDEVEPLRNKETPKKVAFVTENNGDSDEADEGGVELPNLEGQRSRPQRSNVEIVREEEGVPAAEDADEASLGSDVDDEEDEDEDEAESEEDSDEEAQDGDTTRPQRKKSKRHDPDVFANSIQRILSTKLTTRKRADPVLSRSSAAQDAAKTLTDQKLDKAARRKLRADRKAEREKGHEKDVLGLSRDDVSTGEVVELEKMLKRTAQRGVVKLFNAVRAAQVGGMQAERDAQGDHGWKVIGLDSRKKKVDEMSKQGFLDLLASGKAAAG